MQGNELVDVLALTHVETNIASGRDLQLVSHQAISGDAHFSSGRHFSIFDLSANPGDFYSLYDPIISADGDITFGNYSGVSLKVEATGSITGGNIFINGPDVGLTGTDPDIPILVNNHAAILRAGVDTLENPVNLQSDGGATFEGSGNVSTPGSISVGNINSSSFFPSENGSVVILSADGDISTGNLNSSQSQNSGGSIDVTTIGGDVNVGDLDASSLLDDGGSIFIEALGDVTTGEIDITGNGAGGSVVINSNGGSIQTANVEAFTFSSASSTAVNDGESVVRDGDGGTIEFNALSSITTNGDIRTSTDDGSGGSITISSSSGNVEINGGITTFTSETGNGGNVSISASSSVTVDGDISTSSFASSSSSVTSGGSGGNVSISTSSSSSSISVENVFTGGRSDSGQIDLNASEVSSGSISDSTFSSSFSSGSSFLSTPTDEETPSVASFTAPPPPLSIGDTDSLENDFSNEFEQYFGRQFPRRFVTSENIRSALHTLDTRTGANFSRERTAVVYVSSEDSRAFIRVETSQDQAIEKEQLNPETSPPVQTEALESDNREASDEANAENANDDENVEREEVTKDELEEAVRNLHREIQQPGSDNYLEYAAQLYNWLIRPIEAELKEQDIGMLLFSMESGLRLIPLAALYDEQTGQFLGEKYSISIIPNFGSIDVRYKTPEERRGASILAMGASTFRESDTFAPLNAVPLELSLIEDIWYGEGTDERERQFSKNQDFTLDALREARRSTPFQIVHLATHATFRPGDPSNSSIQLWDTALPLNQLQVETLNWNNPPIDLLILSACQTALGDTQAELGFAGLSLQAEVRSTLASLWYVSDLGSLIYMMEFYQHLQNPDLKTKAAVVQQTQMSLLNRQINFQNLQEIDRKIESTLEADRINSGEQLTPSERQGLLRLQNNIRTSGYEISERLTHPFYWSSYTLVGSPW